MSKYVRVMDGTKSNAGGFEYKLDKVNIAKLWNPKTLEQIKWVDLILEPKIKFKLADCLVTLIIQEIIGICLRRE